MKRLILMILFLMLLRWMLMKSLVSSMVLRMLASSYWISFRSELYASIRSSTSSFGVEYLYDVRTEGEVTQKAIYVDKGRG